MISFDICRFIAFEAFLRRLKNHYPVDSAIHLSYNRPENNVDVDTLTNFLAGIENDVTCNGSHCSPRF